MRECSLHEVPERLSVEVIYDVYNILNYYSTPVGEEPRPPNILVRMHHLKVASCREKFLLLAAPVPRQDIQSGWATSGGGREDLLLPQWRWCPWSPSASSPQLQLPAGLEVCRLRRQMECSRTCIPKGIRHLKCFQVSLRTTSCACCSIATSGKMQSDIAPGRKSVYRKPKGTFYVG